MADVGGGGMRLGGGRGSGMRLPPDTSDAEMARYMRTQGMQLPGPPGGSDDLMMAMMGGGGGRGGGPSEYGGFFGMPGGAIAPFARYPPNESGMSREPDRGAGRMWPPQQRPTGAVDSLGVGGPMTQGMFDAGGRDRAAELRQFDRTAGVGGDHLFPADLPPTKQSALPAQQQQQRQYVNMEKSTDDRVSGESKPRVVRFVDEQEPLKQTKSPAVVVSTDVHELHDAKVCSVCQHSERGDVPFSVCYA